MLNRVIFFLLLTAQIQAVDDRFINPVTDVCWSCLFPITVSGVNVTHGHEDLTNYETKVCACPGTPPRVGIPISVWEPTRLVDVTRHPYKLLAMGGMTLGNPGFKTRGSVGSIDNQPNMHSFYHLHWYIFPIISWLELLTDFICLEVSDVDVGWMTELDPLWNNDALATILNPEAFFFSNPLAQAACVPDCAASSFNKPIDALFWCAGCEGSLYPYTGTVAHHEGGLQASSLLVHRIIAKFHRMFLMKGFGVKEFCQSSYVPLIKKSQYKTQIVRPVPQTVGPCHALGKSDMIWGAGKSFPYKGEDFVYLVWRKKQCCLDLLIPAAAVVTGGATL